MELVAHMVCMRGTEKFPESISKLGGILEESVSIQEFHCIDTGATMSEQNVWVSIQVFPCIDTERLKTVSGRCCKGIIGIQAIMLS